MPNLSRTGLSVTALIVAAGRGARMGSAIPKQFLDLGGRPVLAHSIEAFMRHPMIGRLLVMIHDDDYPMYEAAIRTLPEHLALCVSVASGGATRQETVRRGLAHLSERMAFPDEGLVLIHDAARPFVSESLITRAIAAGLRDGAAIPVLPVVDTMAQLDTNGIVVANPDRTTLRAVQTPQVFRFDLIHAAHAAAAQAGRADFTDDAGIVSFAGHPVSTFEGSARAFKLTTPEDVARAAELLAPARTDIRSATGYDVHAFGLGDHIMLGGVRIAHTHGVVGHSDADVLLHALTDALLGTIADGDIGSHFPPSDMRWKGMASHVFLAEAVRLVRLRGGEIRHLDGTVVAEAPKVGPHRDAMRRVIADVANIDISRVSIKATTSESLGFTGRREGIAALATATIALPFKG